MDGQKRVFIFDVDNTLVNTEGLKQSIEQDFLEKFGRTQKKPIFWEIYNQVNKTSGIAEIAEIAALLADKLNIKNRKDIENIFYHASFKKYLFRKAVAIIRKLKETGKVIIYSSGDPDYQAVKIKKIGIEKAVGKENVIIVKNKKKELEKLINRLKEKGYTEIIIVDDKIEILQRAFEIDPQIVSVWIKYGKYKEIHPKGNSPINFEVNSIEEAYDYLQSSISVIFSKDQSIKFTIRRNISGSQIKQLIKYTHKDNQIKKYTHDLGRFKDEKTYRQWIKTGKILYTLIDKNNNLSGLIWFYQKDLPQISYAENFQIKNYPLTFAIRIYSSARGKGLAKKFIKTAFTDFIKSAKYRNFKNKGIWLQTSADNIIARKLYKDIGFEEITTPDKENRIIMAGYLRFPS